MFVKAHNTSDQGNVSDQHCRYTKINSKKSPASGAGKVSQPNLMSQVGTVRVDRRVSVVRAVEVPLFVKFAILALKVVMQYDGDFVDVILLYH